MSDNHDRDEGSINQLLQLLEAIERACEDLQRQADAAVHVNHHNQQPGNYSYCRCSA